MRRNGTGSRRCGWALLAASLMAAVAVAAAAGDAGQSAKRAHSFAARFLEGAFDDLAGDMTAEMQAAMSGHGASKIRNGLLDPNGAVRSVGEAWLEDRLQGYERYRVPVVFERARLDLRIVIDSNGKVAGFFQVPWVPNPAAPVALGEHPAAGHWEGGIELPGKKLGVVLDLAFAGGAWSGSCDIPAQGAEALPLGAFEVRGDEISFRILGLPGPPTFTGTVRDGKLGGTFQQGRLGMPFSLGREAMDRPARPQEPAGRVPYRSEDVTFRNGEIVLAGTLTLPAGEGPFPAALLVTGSGPQNRDEEVFGHKPFLVLADHLTRAGIAVLRADDRGVGGSTGSLRTVTTDDLAGDALAGVESLRGRAEIDPQRVGLIGHSEGGLIAPLVASRSESVAFVVMLAGPGVPGDEVLALQLERIALAAGIEAPKVSQMRSAQVELLRRIKAGAAAEAIQEQLRKLVVAELSAAPGAEPPSDAMVDDVLARQADVASPWFRHFVEYDPRPTLGKVRVPVLALFGELDLQVPPDQSLSPVREALEKGENPDASVRELPRLNHLFQTARSGSPDEYYEIEETMSPLALDAIRDWIVARFVRRAEAAKAAAPPG